MTEKESEEDTQKEKHNKKACTCRYDLKASDEVAIWDGSDSQVLKKIANQNRPKSQLQTIRIVTKLKYNCNTNVIWMR